MLERKYLAMISDSHRTLHRRGSSPVCGDKQREPNDSVGGLRSFDAIHEKLQQAEQLRTSTNRQIDQE